MERKASKCPPMAVSYTYEDMVVTTVWARNRKCRKSLLEGVSVSKSGSERDVIRKSASMTFWTGDKISSDRIID